MNTPISVQNILNSIENLSEEEKTLLFKQLREQSTPTKSENPWIKLAGKYQDDPQYDEVLAYIEQYRYELDAENQPDDSQIKEEEEVKQAS